MKENLVIDGEVFLRSEGHLLYSSPPGNSMLIRADKNLAYECDCLVFFGEELVHEGVCQFKLKESQDGSPLVVFKIDDKNLGHCDGSKRIEIEIPKEVE